MPEITPKEQHPAHHLPVTHPGKRFWQKIMTFIANFSFAMTAVGVVVTLIYGDDVSAPIKAALGATTFIFFAIGIVLHTMGSTSIPDLTIAKDNANERNRNVK
jgi:hypothetical protein